MKIYLGLGTNLGNLENNLVAGIAMIENRIGHITARSGFYLSEPWGFESDNSFLNAVVEVDTELSPDSVLAEIHTIEEKMGRMRKPGKGYQDRIIDVDLLLYGDVIINSEFLTVPHPLMPVRLFVLEPLSEIVAGFLHPVLGKTIAQLLKELKEEGENKAKK